MKLQRILFSFDGRIGRRTYWLAILALIVAVQVLTFAPFLLESEEAAILMLALTSQLIWLLSLWPILAVGSKRFARPQQERLVAAGFLAAALRPVRWRLQHRAL